MQALMIESPVERQHFSVYIASLDHDLLTYAGDLAPSDRSHWEDLFTNMVDRGATKISEAASTIPLNT